MSEKISLDSSERTYLFLVSPEISLYFICEAIPDISFWSKI